MVFDAWFGIGVKTGKGWAVSLRLRVALVLLVGLTSVGLSACGPPPPPPPTLVAPIVGIAASSSGNGYTLVGGDGAIFPYGDAQNYGSEAGQNLAAPIMGMAMKPDGTGYWLVARDGGVFAFGNAGFHGSMGGQHLNAPIVGMAATSNGAGYWLVGADGGIFAFGNANFYGSMGGQTLNKPIVGMAATTNGAGYWLVASDGGIFAFGNAGFHGSLGNQPINKPIVGIAGTANNGGYWLVASDGGVFAFGNAGFYGSAANLGLVCPVSGIARSATGAGYWLTAGDGGVFAYGDAGFYGSAAGGPSPCMTAPGETAEQKVVAWAWKVVNAKGIPSVLGSRAWPAGQPVPYSFGAGHGSVPGPSLGTGEGANTVGVDCGGFTRWMYALATNSDPLSFSIALYQENNRNFAATTSPIPGDLVIFWHPDQSDSHHVGIYIGNGQMIDALHTGTNVEVDSVSGVQGSDTVAYRTYKNN